MATTDRHPTDRHPTAEADDDRHRRRPGPRRVAVAAVGVLLVAGGLLGVRQWDARMSTLLADALVSLDVAATELAGSVAAGEAALADSDGQVTDESLRAALGDALAAAALDLEVPAGSRAERTAHATGLAARALAHATRVRDAAEDVRADVQVWQLAQATAAHAVAVAELSAAIQAGEALLVGTEGMVAPDDASRDRLRAVLDEAIALRDGEVDLEQVDRVRTSVEAVSDVSVRLDEAVQGVADAQGAWQAAEAERVAAEQSAAAAEARKPATGAGSTGSSTPTGTAGGGRPSRGSSTGSSTGSTGGSASAGAGGGGYWVDEGDVPGPDGCVGGDQDGNSWTC